MKTDPSRRDILRLGSPAVLGCGGVGEQLHEAGEPAARRPAGRMVAPFYEADFGPDRFIW